MTWNKSISSRSVSLGDHGGPVVFVADNDTCVRESLDSLIRCAGWRPSICACATEFLSQCRVAAPSCLVLDVALTDASGMDVQQLVADRAGMPVVLTAAHPDIPTIVRAIKAGAVEFLIKPFANEQMLSAIQCALELSRAALTQAWQRQELQDRYVLLTRREREVMHLVVDGCLNKQIAAALHITEFTVKAHRGRVMRKLGVTSVAGLTRMAERLGPTLMARAVTVQPPERRAKPVELMAPSCTMV